MIKWLKKKKVSEECWELNNELVWWLNEHLKTYLEDAKEHIDLEYHTITYKRKTYTQLEVINRLIELTNYLIGADYMEEYTNEKDIIKAKDEMYDLLKQIHFYMWW